MTWQCNTQNNESQITDKLQTNYRHTKDMMETEPSTKTKTTKRQRKKEPIKTTKRQV